MHTTKKSNTFAKNFQDMLLSELKTGEKGIVIKVMGHGGFRKRIIEMGFIKGKTVEVILNAPLQDPVKYRIMGYELSLRRDEAAMIEVVSEAEAAEHTSDTEKDNKPSGGEVVELQVVEHSLKDLAKKKRRTINVALVGNPNCGKTSLFNFASGATEHVGNYSGVTVDAKEGKCEFEGYTFNLVDLPGTYSLTAYSPEELYVRKQIIEKTPDVIINVIDSSNLERNLYLTTQLTELGIPVVVAINMIDLVKKEGDKIDLAELSRQIGCEFVEISALKGEGVQEAAEAAIKAAKGGKTVPQHTFSGVVEHALAHIEEAVLHDMPEERQRWYAVKIFERDSKVLEELHIPEDKMAHIENDIKNAEKELDDDAESIITNERYVYIGSVIKACLKKHSSTKMTVSDKIDRVVTNRWLGLPIFALVMFLVYYLSMAPNAIGTRLTDWANDGLFGDGWHLFGIGSAAYEEVAEEYGDAANVIDAFVGLDEEYTLQTVKNAVSEVAPGSTFFFFFFFEETLATEEVTYT